MNNAKILSGIPEMSYSVPSPVCYIGAVMRLLEYFGDPIEQDELISLSGVGLCFPWRFNSDCDEVSIIPEIPMQTFGALGYESEYFCKEIKPDNKDFYIGKIKQSIDAGRPVIAFGITSHIYTCLITGYYNDGEGLFVRAYWPQGDTPRGYYTSDWYDKCRGILVVGEKTGERLTGAASYQCVTDWALFFRGSRSREVKALGQTYPMNEAAFSVMCEWLLDDDKWQTLTSHEAYLKQSGLLLVAYYRNSVYSYLKRLDAQNPGLVNPPALAELERMSKQFPGSHVSDLWLNECVDPAITDFSMLRSHAIREKVERYVMNISNCDNSIQWTLFMPDFVKKQVGKTNIELISFEYLRLPALRFIGKEGDVDLALPELAVPDKYVCEKMPYNCRIIHHNGHEHYEEAHAVVGKFVNADMPVPEGFVCIDFVPQDNGRAGAPYLSQFAFARYTGAPDALHSEEGFDGGAMYDITRNIILGEGVCIPYPEKYWTAEVLLNDPNCGGFLFSVNCGGA
jgi:hypothetical protein